jgi:hypothetical protein
MLHPHAPVAGRLVQEFVADLGEVVLDAQAPGQGEIRLLGQGEGALFVQIRQGHVGEQPEVFSADVVAHVAVAAHAARILFPPPRDRSTTDADGGCARERFDDPEEGRLGGTRGRTARTGDRNP